jgi:hypothetical protein
MDDEVVIGVGHPLKLPEETPSEEFPERLRLFDLESLLHSLFVGLEELVSSEFVGKVTQGCVVSDTEATHDHVMFLVSEVIEH